MLIQEKIKLVAGCDEVGSGCLAGPVVAAAVILPHDYDGALKDSKQLNSRQREELDIIIRAEAISSAIGLATIEEIDRFNIANASYLAMNRAIEKLAVKPDLLKIDGKYFKTYLDLPYQCIIRGDQKENAIAAASIIAKVYLDQHMRKLASQEPGYRWEDNMGYPTLLHRIAIDELGISQHHRKSCHHVSRKMATTLWDETHKWNSIGDRNKIRKRRKAKS